MKRLIDLLCSGIGLIVFSPLFLILSIWIKSDSQGPVFYKQIRVGKGNKDFKIFKFRSMRQGSDKKGLLTVGERDNRITSSGYFIRKYKLDELAQLINVLIGEMSLVGPRPEVRKYVDLYTIEQMKVLDVRPGITDLASIKYVNENEILKKADDPEKKYIEEIMPEKLNLNLIYIKDGRWWKDFGIIWDTIVAILK